jgi:CRP/FNR family transcriptional regulator
MLPVPDLLRGVPIFRALDDATIEEIRKRCQEKVYLRNEVVFLEGDPPRGFFLVRQGAVKIYKVGDGGREQILEIEGVGRSVAELPVFDGLPYPASCAAMEDAVLLTIPLREFHALLDRHPAITRAIVASLSQRLRRMVALVHELSLVDVRGRLAELLLQLAGDREVVELPWTNQEIAARIGTVREIVSRTFSRMVQQGVIRIEGRSVHLLERERLRSP